MKNTKQSPTKFTNQLPTNLTFSFRDIASMLLDFIRPHPNKRPNFPIPFTKWVATSVPNERTQLTWFGHSAILLEMSGKKILIDPMFGHAPSPISSIFGSKRFTKELAIDLETLPIIDAVIFSHDHYDHLDLPTLKKLKHKVQHYFVPTNFGKHLRKIGVDNSAITELGWWESCTFGDIHLVCTPARHYSGRGLFDGLTTLWASWVIYNNQTRIYFSGDSGYGPHFQEIGLKYGPFDITLIECGQYDPRWSDVHMSPEESFQAHLDLRGKIGCPIHWGGFSLAFHDWNDPAKRFSQAAKNANIPYIIPQFGESVTIPVTNFNQSLWWK